MAGRGAVCWESRLSGSERGWSATLVWTKYCGTAGKLGGQRRKQISSYSQGSLLPTRTASKFQACRNCMAGRFREPSHTGLWRGRCLFGSNGRVHEGKAAGYGSKRLCKDYGDNVGIHHLPAGGSQQPAKTDRRSIIAESIGGIWWGA